MSHPQSADEELAIIRNKLEQATEQLADKDLEIAALKEELAWLRQGHSPLDVTGESSSSSHVFDDGRDDGW